MAGGMEFMDTPVNVPAGVAGSGVAGSRIGGQQSSHNLTAQERAGAMPASVRYRGSNVSVLDDPAAYVAGHGLTFTDPAMASYVTPQQATELVADMVQAMARRANSGSARIAATTVHAVSSSRPDFSGTAAQRDASVHRRVSAHFA
jgi:hypothetical protein